MPYTANEIADCLILRANYDSDETLSNMKLQKLLYYAQGFNMALNNGDLLFRDRVYAWAHGPVVLDVYHRFKENGSAGLPSDGIAAPDLDEDTQALLEEVWQAYGQFSAWRLREMTHREPPWMNTPQNAPIAEAELFAYFSTQVKTAV